MSCRAFLVPVEDSTGQQLEPGGPARWGIRAQHPAHTPRFLLQARPLSPLSRISTRSAGPHPPLQVPAYFRQLPPRRGSACRPMRPRTRRFGTDELCPCRQFAVPCGSGPGPGHSVRPQRPPHHTTRARPRDHHGPLHRRCSAARWTLVVCKQLEASVRRRTVTRLRLKLAQRRAEAVRARCRRKPLRRLSMSLMQERPAEAL